MKTMSEFQFQSGPTIAFAGDSITDCGRRAEAAPYGTGYVRFAIELITARYPDRKLTYVNAGIGGNTVVDLRGRWEDDVLSHDPDWLTVLIGINDLHRTMDQTPTAVPVEQFAVTYEEILREAKERSNPQLVLLDPFYMIRPEDADERQRTVLAMLPEYIAVVDKLCETFGARHITTHVLFERHLSHRPAATFCAEPVHPNSAGHHVIANALLEAVGW